jgi:hypothetical protein
LFIVFLLGAALDYIELERPVRELVLPFTLLVLVILITVRAGMADYENYVDTFYEVPDFGKSGFADIHGEIGYLYLNTFIRTIGANHYVLFALVGAASVALSLQFFRKYTPYFLVSLLIYFSHVFLLREMIQIRAGLAIAIVMFAIPYVERRKFLPVLLIVAAAALFHSVSWLFLLLYFSYPILSSSRNQLMLLGAGLVAGLVLNIGFLEMALTMLGAPAIVLNYLMDEQYNYSLGLVNPVLIKHFLVIGFILYNREFFEERVKHFKVLLVCYVIAAFWLSAFNNFAIFSGRIATMFSNVEHVLIPSLLLVTKYKALIFTLIVVYALFSFVSKLEMLSTWTFIFSK